MKQPAERIDELTLCYVAGCNERWTDSIRSPVDLHDPRVPLTALEPYEEVTLRLCRRCLASIRGTNERRMELKRSLREYWDEQRAADRES